VENQTINRQYKFSKEADGYKTDADDYANCQELTVTITLHEYRDLLERNTRYSNRISELTDKNNALTDKNKELTAKIASLSEKIIREV